MLLAAAFSASWGTIGRSVCSSGGCVRSVKPGRMWQGGAPEVRSGDAGWMHAGSTPPNLRHRRRGVASSARPLLDPWKATMRSHGQGMGKSAPRPCLVSGAYSIHSERGYALCVDAERGRRLGKIR
eukprot:5220094-Pleurochrysis_carterae.AAC.1